MRDMAMETYPQYKDATSGPDSLRTRKMNIHKVLDFILSVKKENCHKFTPEQLILNGGYKFGAEEFFENEAKMALRLANFISAFLQASVKISLIKMF